MRMLVLAVLASCAACSPTTVKVQMNQQNNSGEDGTATLTDLGGGQLKVVISLTPGTDTGQQAAHIHEGTCPGLVKIVFPLSPVVNGQSTSTITATLSDVEDNNHVINVHNSVTSTSYVSCGQIP